MFLCLSKEDCVTYPDDTAILVIGFSARHCLDRLIDGQPDVFKPFGLFDSSKSRCTFFTRNLGQITIRRLIKIPPIFRYASDFPVYLNSATDFLLTFPPQSAKRVFAWLDSASRQLVIVIFPDVQQSDLVVRIKNHSPDSQSSL